MFLLQGIDLGGHGHDLFLIFCGLAPGIFLIQKSGFILVFGPDHEVLCCERCPSIVTLALEVLDVDDELFIWGRFVGFPEIVEKVKCFLFSSMKVAHLFSHPLVELCDVTFEKQQFSLRFDQHLPDVHGGCQVVHPGEDNFLLQEC